MADLSHLSDEELIAAMNGANQSPKLPVNTSSPVPSNIDGQGFADVNATNIANYPGMSDSPVVTIHPTVTDDLSHLSDADLMKAAGIPAAGTKDALQANFEAKKNGVAKGPISAFGEGLANAVPFGQKITSGMAAAALAPFTNLTMGQLYDQAQADTQATAEANPKSSIAGTIAGIGTTLPLMSAKVIAGGPAAVDGVRGAINAIPAGLAKAGNFARGGNAVTTPIRSALVAAPGGALYGAGDAEPGDMLGGAERGAGVAAAIGGALPVAGGILGAGTIGTANLFKGALARNVDKLQETGRALKADASSVYKQFRDTGAVIEPKAMGRIFHTIDDELKDSGLMNESLHGKTLSVVGQLREEAANGALSLEGLDQYRQLLGDVIRSDTDVAGRLGPDAFKAKTAIRALDDSIDSLGDKDIIGDAKAVDLLKTARQKWSQQRKFDDITRIVEKSGGDANKLKANLQRFADNDKKTKGFTIEEKAALNYAAKNSTGEGLLKLAGKFGFDLGSSLSVGNAGLPSLFGATTAATGTAGVGAGVVAGGTAARLAQKMVARGKTADLLKLIESGGKTGKTAKAISGNAKSIAKNKAAVQTSREELQQEFLDKKAIPVVTIRPKGSK